LKLWSGMVKLRPAKPSIVSWADGEAPCKYSKSAKLKKPCRSLFLGREHMNIREVMLRSVRSGLRVVPAVVIAVGGTLALAPQANADAAKTCPPLSQGYWKTHPVAWTGKTLKL